MGHWRLRNFEARVVKWSFFVGAEVIPYIGRKWGRKERKTVSQKPKSAWVNWVVCSLLEI